MIILDPQSIVGVDLNCTIMDHIATIIALSGWKLSPPDFSVWDPPIGHKIGMSESDFVNWAWKNPDIQMMSYPFDGAKEAIANLKKIGHHIRIITSTCLRPSQVIAWLDHFQIPFDDIFFVKDKTQVIFDILFDDSPVVIDQVLQAGRNIVKFNTAWNEHIDCPSISNWAEVAR